MEHDAFLRNKEHSTLEQDILGDLQDDKQGYSYRSSPPLQPHPTGHPDGTDDRQDRVDPYRSAFSPQRPFSPYGPSAPLEGFSSSRHSMNSSSGASAIGASGHQYPMHALNSHHGSNSHLPAFYQHQQRTPTSSVYGGQGERYQDKEGSVIGLTGRPSPLLKNQSNYRPVLDMTAAEEEENAEILQKITRSNGSRPSHKSKTKRRHRDTSDTDDEEEGQERGEMRQRETKRCWCCSRRMCVYMTSLFLFLLAVVLYFVVPRSPGFSFVSVASMGDLVVTRNQIQEPFSIQLRVDSEENYVPLRLDSIEMTVWLKFDHTKIASNEGLSSSFDIKPRVVQQISVPMMLDYKTYKIDTNADPTLQELISACQPAQGGVVRGIHLTIGGKMRFRGLSWIWKPEFGINVENVPCPVNAKDPMTSSPSPPMEPAPAPATLSPSPSSASAPANENASSRPSATGGTIPTGSPVATGSRPT